MAGELALTGVLPFVFLVGAAIAYPLSLFLLKRYRAAVLRMMAASGGAAPVAGDEPERAGGAAAGRLEIQVIDESSTPSPGEAVTAMHERMGRRLRANVRAYAAGGLVYAVVMATAQLLADELFSPLRLVVMVYIYSWPTVIAINLILPSTRRVRVATFGGYFAGLFLLSVVAVSVSTDLAIFGLFIAWGLFSLPATILVLAFLHRRVRAVGVMVLAFTVLALVGANVALEIVGSDASLLRAAAGAGFAVGLGAAGTFVTIIIAGALIFGVIAWFANRWIKRGYLNKRLNDQSLVLDSMWLVFAMIQSIGLAFSGMVWYLAGMAAFLAYKLTVMASLKARSSPAGAEARPVNLLFLRVFSHGRLREAVFDSVSSRWRYAGSIQMIAGPDLATTTVEPNEFLEYLSGRISLAFISSPATLDKKMGELDRAPDFDGRYRVNDFFCYDNTWRSVLSRLVRESDAVLVDARGFSPGNAGLIFELKALVNLIALDRVVLLADRSTDNSLLDRTLQDAWAGLASDSPNRGATDVKLKICMLEPERSGEGPQVLQALCSAVMSQ
jgi:hypothetical protein